MREIEVTGIFPAYSWEEKNELSHLIVEGEPVTVVEEYEVSGGDGVPDGIPFTRFSFKVDQFYKGSIETETIELLQEGNSTAEFSNHQLLEIGQKYILFLEKSSNDQLIMLGGPTSKYEFEPSEKRYVNMYGEKINTNNAEKLTHEEND